MTKDSDTGFGIGSDVDENPYNEVYSNEIGKNRYCSSLHHSAVSGTLRGFVNRHGIDYAVFQPSIVYDPEGRAHINRADAQELIMPFDTLRPIFPGSLEGWAKKYNSELQRKKKKEKI